jgi:hypothetical protein
VQGFGCQAASLRRAFCIGGSDTDGQLHTPGLANAAVVHGCTTALR